MPCPRTGGLGQGQEPQSAYKKFAGPSEGAAEGRGLGEEFRRARAKFSEIRVRIFPKIRSDFFQRSEPDRNL